MHQAVKDAEEAGILLTAAAGNTEHQDINYPAAYDEVIAVGSINAEGKLAELTSTGTELELLAPGEQVCTTGLFYGTIGVSGTSIATAQVTGAAAMLKTKDKTKSADFIRGLLKTSSKEVEGTNAGLIDCEYALEIYDEYAKNYTKGEKAFKKLENNEAVPDYSKQADIVVEGLWSAHTKLNDLYGSGHGQIIKSVTSKSGISQKNIDYMARTANLADKGDGKKVGSQYYKTIKAFHGKANYVASLKFLWKYANLIGQGKSYSDAKNITKTAIDKSKAKNKHEIKLAINATEYMLKEQSKAHNNKLNKTNKKFLVMGFIMHLIGDTYAHSTVVPDYVLTGEVKKAKYSTDDKSYDARLGKNDFRNDDSYYKEISNKNNFNAQIKLIAENDSSKKYPKIGWKCLKETVNNQTLIFRRIKFFMKESSNSKYEDNIKFCEERYRIAKKVSKNYMSKYTKSFSNILESKGHVKLYEYSTYKNQL